MIRLTAVVLLTLLPASAALGHHGVASLGVAGLEGPGAPIETANSATLPGRRFLASLKLDYASFEKLTQERDDETDFNAYWMYGVGYGATSYLSAYLLIPFTTKRAEDNSYNTSGFTDLSLMTALGWKYDGGFRLVPESESLDDMEDPHFTLYGGMTLPTGNENLRAKDGEIDPGMSLGFGAPSYSAGLTATKQVAGRFTFCGEASWIGFSEHEYADSTKVRFGGEFRLNAASAARVLLRPASKLRCDVNLEANYLQLGRDEVAGVGEQATGGRILYGVPGLRLFMGSSSVGLGVKVPVWKSLNEEKEQQGAEGKESYRLIFTFSTLI
ncbi:MAG: transporter [Candidatus Eisenbacteria bacterium]|nr:transporter [Candidatus Eisenbacteria bacterium]